MSDWFERAMAKTTKNPETGCWEYAGEIVHNGYGRISFCGKNVRLHRLSYSQHHGEIPVGMLVCHKCDVRNCWNPDHLFVGTDQDNIRDMHAKGRGFTPKPYVGRGEQVHSSKLSEDSVREIRRLVPLGMTHGTLAKRFGVSTRAIFSAVHGESWSHVV